MTHYIDKDRIAAELERRRSRNSRNKLNLAAAFEDNYLLSFIDTLEVEELPIWEKVSPDTGQTTLYKDGDKSYLERFGYRIDLKDLDKLPKKNSTHRTPADIEAAMQEVEEKSEAYTDAHMGERDDDVLSQMRGEPVSYPVTVADRCIAEIIIIHLKRIENDYLIDLTKEMEWIRNQVKKGG